MRQTAWKDAYEGSKSATERVWNRSDVSLGHNSFRSVYNEVGEVYLNSPHITTALTHSTTLFPGSIEDDRHLATVLQRVMVISDFQLPF